METHTYTYKAKKVFSCSWMYLLAFCISIIFILVHCMVREAWIFGENNMLFGDAATQYIYFMSELWEKVHNGTSLFYSRSAGMGYDFYCNAAYYLFSPFNIIVLLLPKNHIENAVQFIAILKWALCSVTMAYYFMNTTRNKMTQSRELISVVLGVAYSFSKYLISYIFCYIWFDVFLLFPLLILNFERMIDTGKWKKYYFILVLCMLCNFYMTFPVCIFLVIFFFNQKRDSIYSWVHSGILFALTSILAAISSAVVILPCIMTAKERYINDVTDFEQMKYIVCDYLDIIKGSYFLSSSEGTYDRVPCLYIGIFSFLILICFLFSKMYWKYKLKRIITVVILVSSFLIPNLNYIWHGCSVPHGFYHRFTFIFVFFALYVCMETIPYLKQCRIRYIIGGMVLWLIVYVTEFFMETDLYDFYVYLGMLLLFVLYGMLLILYRRKSFTSKQFSYIMCIFTCLELVLNAYVLLDDCIGSTVENRNNNKAILSLAADIDLEEGERITYMSFDSDIGMWFGKESVPVFESFVNGKMLNFARKMGVSTFENDATMSYNGGSPIMNIIFNVRYGIGESEMCFSDADIIQTADDVQLYRMKNLAGLGYMVDNSVTEWNLDDNNVFKMQNDFIEKTTGIKDVFRILEDDLLCAVNFEQKSKDEEGYYTYNAMGFLDNIVVEYTVPKDMDLYVYMDNTIYGLCTTMIDGEIVYSSTIPAKIKTVHIGDVKEGQLIKLSMSLTESTVNEAGKFQCQLAEFDQEKFEIASEKLKQAVLEINDYTDSYISGQIDVLQEGIMMTSVQAVDGYSVYVDGKKTEYIKLGDGTFIGVPLEVGKHTIEFKYVTPYFFCGLSVTILGIFIFGLLCIMGKYKVNQYKRSSLWNEVDKGNN